MAGNFVLTKDNVLMSPKIAARTGAPEAAGWVCPRCGGTESRYDDGLTWCIACRFWVEGQPNAWNQPM